MASTRPGSSMKLSTMGGNVGWLRATAGQVSTIAEARLRTRRFIAPGASQKDVELGEPGRDAGMARGRGAGAGGAEARVDAVEAKIHVRKEEPDGRDPAVERRWLS